MVVRLRQPGPVPMGDARPAIPGAPRHNAMIVCALHRLVAARAVMTVVDPRRRVPAATTGHAAMIVAATHAVMMKQAQRPTLTGRLELFTGSGRSAN